MKKMQFIPFLGVILLALALAWPASARQATGLKLSMGKNVGFQAGNKVQGSIGLRVSGPDNLAKVEYFIDGAKIGESTQVPSYKVSFNTSSFAMGTHAIVAVGTLADGSQVRSNEIPGEFVTAEEGWQYATKLMIPLLVIVGAVLVLTVVFSVATGRKNKDLPLGSERRYGASGGAICSRCHRPFPRNLFSMNMGLGSKLERCPYCGKWQLTRARPLAELRAAEAAEVDQAAGPAPALSEEERLRKELDDSRFRDI